MWDVILNADNQLTRTPRITRSADWKDSLSCLPPVLVACYPGPLRYWKSCVLQHFHNEVVKYVQRTSNTDNVTRQKHGYCMIRRSKTGSPIGTCAHISWGISVVVSSKSKHSALTHLFEWPHLQDLLDSGVVCAMLTRGSARVLQEVLNGHMLEALVQTSLLNHLLASERKLWWSLKLCKQHTI